MLSKEPAGIALKQVVYVQQLVKAKDELLTILLIATYHAFGMLLQWYGKRIVTLCPWVIFEYN